MYFFSNHVKYNNKRIVSITICPSSLRTASQPNVQFQQACSAKYFKGIGMKQNMTKIFKNLFETNNNLCPFLVPISH